MYRTFACVLWCYSTVVYSDYIDSTSHTHTSGLRPYNVRGATGERTVGVFP